MTIPADFGKVVGQKSHFTVERWGNGWAITVHRVAKPLQTILCQSPGEVNRLRLELSDEGLCGYVGKGA